MSRGAATSSTRCRSVSRWRTQIHAPTAASALRRSRAWSKYDCTTNCRPPHPLRVGKYLTPQFAAAHTSIRLGIAGCNGAHTSPAQHPHTCCGQQLCLSRECRRLQRLCRCGFAQLQRCRETRTHGSDDAHARGLLPDDHGVRCLVLWHTVHRQRQGQRARGVCTRVDQSPSDHCLSAELTAKECCAKRCSCSAHLRTRVARGGSAWIRSRSVRSRASHFPSSRK